MRRKDLVTIICDSSEDNNDPSRFRVTQSPDRSIKLEALFWNEDNRGVCILDDSRDFPHINNLRDLRQFRDFLNEVLALNDLK